MNQMRLALIATALWSGSALVVRADGTFTITQDTQTDFAAQWGPGPTGAGWVYNAPLNMNIVGTNWSFTLRIIQASIPDPNQPGGTINGWTVAYTIRHLIPPHGEGENIFDVPISPAGPFFFADSVLGTIADATINSGSRAHGNHLDTWTFALDRSPGNGYSGSVSFHHTPAPGAMALLGIGGLVQARRRRG